MNLHGALHQAKNLLESYGSMTRTLASVNFSSRNYKEQIEKVLVEVLRDGVESFDGSAGCAAIYLPDATQSYLSCRVSYRMDEHRQRENMRFYIGKYDESKEEGVGVKGLTYRQRILLTGHMSVGPDGSWQCEHERYRKHKNGIMGKDPLYKSFASVPIIGIDGDMSVCFGVVWLDSKHEKTFDSEKVKYVLLELARKISCIISMCKNHGRDV